MQPSEGDKAGPLVWKKARSLGCYVDFESAFPEPEPKPGLTAYAHTYIFSEEAGAVALRASALPSEALRVWMNGQMVVKETNWAANQTAYKADVHQGWNRLLVKVVRAEAVPCHISPWHLSFFFYAAESHEYAKPKNIVWVARIPGGDGCMCNPVVVGDRVITECDPFDVICVSKKDGKLLWIRSASYYDTLTDEEKNSPAFKDLAPLAKKVLEINALLCSGPYDQKLVDEKLKAQDQILRAMKKADKKRFGELGIIALDSMPHPASSSPTPCSDGRNVYVWMGLGVVTAFDLDGNRKWIHYEKTKPIDEHGNNSSPVLAAGRVIIYDGGPRTTVAFDPETGSEVWRVTNDSLRKLYPTVFVGHFSGAPNGHGTPLLFKVAGTEVVLMQNVALRASDGAVLWVADPRNRYGNNVPTPVISDGKIYFAADGCDGRKLHITKLPGAFEPDGKLKLEELGAIEILKPGVQEVGEIVCGSPLVHEGLVYLADMLGRLRVVDARDPANPKFLYQSSDCFPSSRAPVYHMGSCYASPLLLGKNICYMSHTGTFLIVQPGPEYKVLARNRLENRMPSARAHVYLEHPEFFNGAPVVDGDRIYIRGDDNLYCIGEMESR